MTDRTTFKISEQDVDKLVKKVIKHFKKACESCLTAYRLCGDIDANTLENCFEELKGRDDVDKNDILAVAKCLDYVKNYMTASVAELDVREDRSPDVGVLVFATKRPGVSGERAVSVRIGVYIDPHGDGRSRPAIMTIRMLDPRKDAENIAQMLHALRENPQVLELLEQVVTKLGEELAKEIKSTPRTGKRKVKMEEIPEEEETIVEEEGEKERLTEKKVEKKPTKKPKKGKSSNEEVHEKLEKVEIKHADELLEEGE